MAADRPTLFGLGSFGKLTLSACALDRIEAGALGLERVLDLAAERVPERVSAAIRRH